MELNHTDALNRLDASRRMNSSRGRLIEQPTLNEHRLDADRLTQSASATIT